MTTELENLESEEELITTAQQAISQCNWVVGECAAKWTERYAKGRTDTDFSALIGLSPDQVYQRRRVWETFSDVYADYNRLKWSHFYVALNWEDAPECLQWAEENEATVVEMKAWRRALRGEDLTTDADEQQTDMMSGDPGIAFVPDQLSTVQDPASFAQPALAGETSAELAGVQRAGSASETVQGVARETGEKPYAPFNSGVVTPPRAVGEEPPKSTVPLSVQAEQFLKKMTGTLNRMSKTLSPELIKVMKERSDEELEEFQTAYESFQEKVKLLS